MVELIREPGGAWAECEDALDRRGTPLPLFHRSIWASTIAARGGRSLFFSILDDDNTCRAGFSAESWASRAMPGHRLLSVARLGVGTAGLDAASLDAGLARLVAHARDEQSVLHIRVGVFALAPEDRVTTSEALRRHGFLQAPRSRSYERTLVVDLTPDPETLLAGFHYNARRRIRNVAKFPVRLATADSVTLAARLQELGDETHRRTGGESRPVDWVSLIQLSNEAPHLSRIAILERTDREGPSAVLAFAWGCMQGRVVEYSEAGSTHPPDMKVSTSYALMWDLISWARRSGAHTFDLGGVTPGGSLGDDPLGGISDFKRNFSQLEVEVGSEWHFEPRPRRAAAARAISRTAAILKRGASWIGR